MSTPQKYKITLEQLRMAANKYKIRRMNPCAEQFERLFSAMEATNCNYMHMRKQITELDACLARNKGTTTNLGEKKSVMFELNKYLDQGRSKTK